MRPPKRAEPIWFMEKKMEQIQLDDSERQPVECWTRVMGYFRPISSYNIGKRGEFAARKYFKEPEGLSDGDD